METKERVVSSIKLGKVCISVVNVTLTGVKFDKALSDDENRELNEYFALVIEADKAIGGRFPVRYYLTDDEAASAKYAMKKTFEMCEVIKKGQRNDDEGGEQ